MRAGPRRAFLPTLGKSTSVGDQRPLRIGILGTARVAEKSIVAPARELGHWLIAVADWDRAHTETIASAHGIERVVDTYADLITDPGGDLVYNPLPNGLPGGPWNVAALEAGKQHVLTEKPSASNAQEAAEVHVPGAAAGTVFTEDIHHLLPVPLCRPSSPRTGRERRVG